MTVIHSSGWRYWAAMDAMSATVARRTKALVSHPATISLCIRSHTRPGAPSRYSPVLRNSTPRRKAGTPTPNMVSNTGSSGRAWGSSSGWAVFSGSTGLGMSATRIRSEVARAISTSRSGPEKSDVRTTWIRRPDRSTSTSGRSGVSGTPRIMSTVCRAVRMGAGTGTVSTRWARMPEIGPPCWMVGSQGPPVSGPGTSRPSRSP